MGHVSPNRCSSFTLLLARGKLISNEMQEKLQLGADAVEELFERAMASRQLDGHLEELIKIYEARADFHRREVDSLRSSSSPTRLHAS